MIFFNFKIVTVALSQTHIQDAFFVITENETTRGTPCTAGKAKTVEKKPAKPGLKNPNNFNKRQKKLHLEL